MIKKGQHTICVHTGEIKDEQFGGAVSPIYLASSYPFLDVETKRYPRYFNTPNQEVIAKKVAALEHGEAGLAFASGMAAISTSLLAILKPGDHVVFQNEIYGGTYNLICKDFDELGIAYSFTKGVEPQDFESEIKPNTKLIYLETPSNPLLTIIDIKAVVSIAKRFGAMTMIDNTFASPINQTPIDLGVDVVLHSATKYLGGHSDILAGVVVSSQECIDKIYQKGIILGGNLSDFMCYLLERSIKTLGVRIAKHNENAMRVAQFLNNHKNVEQVFYPGLPTHHNHKIAKEQMNGFGGMLSFKTHPSVDLVKFRKSLGMIKPSMSLAGVETTILLPVLTSHALMSEEDREQQGISDNLWRLSVGIENAEDIINDLDHALSN